MNMNLKSLRMVLALVLVFSAIGFSALPVLADAPVKSYNVYSETLVMTQPCSFPVTVFSTYTFTDILFFDKAGGVPRDYDHVVEVDVFTANEKTLTSLPYTYNIDWLIDSEGNVNHEYVEGQVVKVPLPDGTMFFSAGRFDVMDHPGQIGFASPDHGHTGNIAAFCAALAP
jgi:hypothetical protein